MKTLHAFTMTVALATPAALVADVQVDGPEIRNARAVVQIGDATVSFDVDRGVMLSGDTVSGVMVATSARAHDVVVDVVAMQDMGFGQERIPNPPVEVGKRTLTLHARPGGGPPVVASFKLGSRHEAKGITHWFDLHVHEHGKAAADEEALAGVATFGGNPFEISIEPPAKIPAKGPFTIAVRIKNTTKKPLDYVYVNLGSMLAMEGIDGIRTTAQDYDVTPVEDPTAGDADSTVIQPGAEQLAIYKITPKDDTQRHFTFVARAQTSERDGMEVRAFDRAEPEPEADHAPGSVATR